MKILIGAACIAVIAFVGYYFWGEYRQHEIENQASKLAAFDQICDSIVTSGASGLSDAQLNACLDYAMSGKPADFVPPQ